jgi:photosystem II stability/assembly factor-like uncharacterized protein
MKKFIYLLVFFTIFVKYNSAQQSGWFWLNPLPTGNTLKSVIFVNSSIGWFVGDGGQIFKSTDGGETWESQSSGTHIHFNSVYFIDEFNGWAVGENGTILMTTNGGEVWASQTSGTNLRLSCVHAIGLFSLAQANS